MTSKTSYVKISLIYACISLIPVVPIFAILIFGTFFYTEDWFGVPCSKIAVPVFIASILAVLLIIALIKKIVRTKNFILYTLCSFLIYLFVFNITFQLNTSFNYFCLTDGQIIMYIIYPAFFATCSIVIFGLYADHKIEKHKL